ncbi:WD repeat-containing protein 90 [Phytophthora citrophthora]|uniref:WD repeat-containing protein 90 n=1 Tax=Phytophthora citrophthora TaxID=4793 RepID=A0AAD9LP48_9STRA|nr:WD repeat-containing protein 90 [Phytophthora citrophthora]
MPVWQDPFVEVIKYGMTHRNVGWYTQGDVEETQDQHIHKNVFKIRGAIAAANYLRFPRDAAKGTHGLGLTGRYVYLQVRRVGNQPMTIHLDFVTSKKTALRFTISSLYELFRSTGTVLRVPLSLDARWTVVVVDMVRLLERHPFNQHTRDTYRHLKTITLCASMNLRNVFISSTLYTPKTLPRSLQFCGDFGEQYCWIMVPLDDNPSLDHRHFDAVKQEDLRIAATSTPVTRLRRGSIESVLSADYETKVEGVSPIRREVIAKISPRTKDANIRRDRNEILSKTDQILRDAGVFDINTGTNQESVDASYQSPLASPIVKFTPGLKQGLRTRIVSSSTKTEWPDPILELDRVIGFSNDFPRMLLWVPDGSACIYSSSSTIVYREFCCESKLASGIADNSTEAVKGSVETSEPMTTTKEHFLYGHCAAICSLAITNDGQYLASTEQPVEAQQNGIRLWDLTRRECITIVKAQPKGVHALCFSPLSKNRLLLCVVGRDECFRTQIFVWDCSSLQNGKQKSVNLMARQTSDFPIDQIAFSPYEQHDQFHLVSCGRENVRYWRVNPNSGHLTGTPVILNEYSRGTVFNDIGFDTLVDSHPSNIHRVRPLYVASSLGTLLVVDYDSKQVICVYQLHDASINCLSVNEGFCVTGSNDCFLRVWSLDFTDFFLEAYHEAGVSWLDVSADGMKVLVGSRNNSIGVLDISDQQYATLLRSHTKTITAMAPAPWESPLASLVLDDIRPGGVGTAESELITASSDGTLRVWDTMSGHQLYEFGMQQEQVTCLAASPVHSGIVAVGFVSGCTRIFDVHRTDSTKETPSSMLHEFRQHQSSIQHIAFDTGGQHLYTSGAGKQLCLYDAQQSEYLPLKMLLADFDAEDGRFEVSHDKKWLVLISSDRRDVLMLDPSSLRVIATVRPPKPEETLKLARFSNHSAELLVLSASDKLHVFSLPGREFVQSMPLLGQEGISTIVLSTNAKYMATGGTNGSIRVWNWDDRGNIGRMHQSFIGHAGKVNELAFTKDGKRLVGTGESSAICIWQFHGDSAPLSPREKSGPMNANVFKLYGLEDDNDEANVGNSKINFRLSLEDDALKLTSQNENELASVLSNATDFQSIDIETNVMEITSSISGDLCLASTIGGVNVTNFTWSYSTGKIVYTINSILVVEDIASGKKQFYEDFRDEAEIVVMELSSTGDAVAMISSQFDVIKVRSLTSSHESNTSAENLVEIPLLPDIHIVSSLAFSQNNPEGNNQELLCMACEFGKPDLQHSTVIVVASIAQRSIIWSSMNSSDFQAENIQQIVSTPDSQFLLLSAERSSISTLTVSGIEPEAKLESLIVSFPTPVQLISLFNKHGKIDRLRFLVGVDNDRYCYFYDLQQSTFIATTQLLLLPSKAKYPKQEDTEIKNSCSSRKTVEFMEWVTTAGKSLLITGSRTENVLYVHGIPMLSTKHSARVQIDWQRLARAGVSLVCKISLTRSGLLRSLSVDPVRDVGIATTNEGAVVLVHFDASPTVKVLRGPARDDSDSGSPFAAAFALNGSVLLSTAKNDDAIRVWLPELSREIASFQVDSAVCTCFAVNPFSTPDGVPGSSVMAGYSDGSLRVFDLCEMRLLSRFELSPSSAKSTRVIFDRILFVGAFTALVVTKCNSVLLVDISNAWEGRGETPNPTPPKRTSLRQCKSAQVRSKTNLKPRIKGRKSEREVVYRELTLLPSSYVRRKRLPGLAKSEQIDVHIGVVDVMESGEATVHPFVIVVKYTGPVRYGHGRCVVKVFADPTMSVSNGEEISPTDEWRLHTNPNLDQCVATFIPSSSGSVQVLYSCTVQQTEHNSVSKPWKMELRDCLQQRVIRRFYLGISNSRLETPVLLRSISVDLSRDAPEATEVMLLVDSSGNMAVLDLNDRQLVPINTQLIQHLHLQPCSISRTSSSLLLSSPTQLAIANLIFH